MHKKILLTAVTLASAHSASWAADPEKPPRSSGELESVVVTATRRAEERLQDVPISIAVIGGEDLQRRGAAGMTDYMTGVPGTAVVDLGGLSNAVVIRGITTSPISENFGSGPTVSSYFDETPFTGSGGILGGGSDIRPVDLERIEVLRGPQGTAFGDASLGGTLRMIPMKPNLDTFSTKISGDYSQTSGSGGDNSRLQGVINFPIIPGALAIRAVGYHYDDSGYYKNVVGLNPTSVATAESWGGGDAVRGFVRSDMGGERTTGGRLSALWRPSEKISIASNLLKQKIEQDGLARSVNGAFGDYAQLDYPIVEPARIDGKDVPVFDSDIGLGNLVIQYALPWAQWTTTGSYVRSTPQFNSDVSLYFNLPISEANASNFKSITGETRLASVLSGRFQYLAGLFYQKVASDGVDRLIGEDDPALNPFGENPIAVLELKRRIDQKAVFSELSYDITPHLTATVGGRYFMYDRDERQGSSGALNGIPLTAPIESRLSSGENHSNFKGNLRYKWSDDSTVYASWAQGFRLGRPSAGLTNATSRCDLNNDDLVDGTTVSISSTNEVKSDFLDSYEVGGKFALFDRRVILDGSAYHISWDQLPVLTSVTCAGTFVFYTVNAGKAVSDGADLQATILATDRLKIDIGIGYTDAQIDEDVPAQMWEKGSRLPNSPRWNGNLSAQYELSFLTYNAFVRADSVYRGDSYASPIASADNKSDSFTRIDLRAGLSMSSVALELYVKNLTNRDASTLTNIDIFGVTNYRIRPRTVGLQLSYEFK